MTRPTVNFPRILACVAAAVPLFAASLPAQTNTAVVPNRLTQPIDESVRVTLHGYIAPQANAANDRGAAPDSMPLERLHLVLRRSPAQEADLQQLIAQMHTPGSASYHKWLTPTQFGQQFGPSDQDVVAVESWLSSHGFQVTGVEPGKQVIEFNGNVAELREAFSAQIHRFQGADGNIHYATATEPQIPAALAPVVGGFDSLNDFRPHLHDHVLGTATYNPKTDHATANWTYGNSSGVSFVLGPGDFAVQYDLPTSTAQQGQGESIAILDFSNVNMDLVKQFRAMFGLSTSNLPQVVIDGNDPGIDGINNPDGPYFGSSGESYLDVEWAGAVAPQATIDLVIAADTALENGGLLAAEHAVYGNIAPIISSSIDVGGCEQEAGSLNAFMSSLWEQAAAQGQTVVVAAGDDGSAGCDDDDTQEYAVNGLGVNSWASTPYDVAAGGTDFYYTGYQNLTLQDLSTYWNTTPTQNPGTSLLQRIPEQPWNDSQYGLDAVNYYTATDGATSIAAGSGGASSSAVCLDNDYDPTTGACDSSVSGYAKPAWQTGTGTQTDKVRDIPDVSLFAADGLNYSYYPICASDGDCQTPTGSNLYQITGVGGTSAAAPTFAAIMALVDQQYGPQGQADFVLYPLKTQFPAAFHDITVGTNSVPCESGTADCISVAGGLTVGGVLEGQIGTGTTPDYNAAAGYSLATGLGSVDANVLINDWSKVTFKSTTTTLTPSSTSFTHGTAIGITGSVTGSTTPTGSIALMTDSPTPLQQGQGAFTLSNGSIPSGTTVNYLPGGTYDIWGQYSGDGTNAASTSTKTQITVNPEASTNYFNILNTAVTSTGSAAVDEPSGSSVPYGTQLILDSEIVPTTFYNTCINTSSPPTSCNTATFTSPTGTVTFKDGGSAINTAVINVEGDAEYNAAFSVGSHSVTSTYAGDPSYQASNGAAISFTVTKATPAIGVSASNQNSSGAFINGQATVVNIQVENTSNETVEGYGVGSAVPVAAPTGTVTVTGLPGGTLTATLSAANDPNDYFVEGVGTITLPATVAANTYNVTVTYSGDSNYTSTSASGSVTVIAPSSTLLTSTTTATMSGAISPVSSITVTGSVTGQAGHAAPTGSVTFFSSGNSIGSLGFTSSSGDVSYFAVTLDSQDLFQGANFITIQYSGDSNYNPSAFTLNNGNAINSPLSDFSMVPNSVNIPTTPSTAGTDTIQLSSVNGFSGTVTYTCSAAAGVTCTVSPTSTTFSSGSTSTTTVTINANSSTVNGNYNVEVTGTDSTGEYIHTLGLTAIVTGSSSTGTSPGFNLTNSGSITVAPGGTGTSTLTVAPTNSFTGTVNFSCAISGTPTGLSCAAPSADITGTASVTSTLTATATSSAAAGTYTATVTASDAATGTITATTTVSITVTGPSYALSNSGDLNIAAGSSGTATITVTPSNGFTGTVNFTCSASGSPGGVSCSAPSATVSGTSAVTSTLTVTASSTSAAVRFPLQKFLTGAGGVMLAFVVFFGIPARRKSWHTILGLLIVIALAAGISGCGGSSGTTPPPQSATYTVTVTGTSGTTTQTTSLTVTVTSS